MFFFLGGGDGCLVLTGTCFNFQIWNLISPHTFSISIYKLGIFFHSLTLLLTLDNTTPFEYLCAQSPHQLHLISSIHHILHESTPLTETTHLYMRRWAHLIGRPISSQLWDRIWSSTFKSSKCVLQRETSIKILMFWYKTPEVIHKYDSSISAKCWCCGTGVGSLFHIFWQCPMIQPLWHEVMILIQKVVDVSLPLDPLHYLLGLPFSGITKKGSRLISYTLLAAKRHSIMLASQHFSPMVQISSIDSWDSKDGIPDGLCTR